MNELVSHSIPDQAEVKEDFLGFVDVTGHTTGEDLSSTIVQQISNFQLDMSFLRGQCYDGAGRDVLHLEGA